MIACVTFETTKVTSPAVYYEINRIHLIHYLRDPGSEQGKVYAEFYDRVVEILEEESPQKMEFVEHNESVSNFSVMLRTVLSIIQGEREAERDCEVYVNVSSGSPEYSAAATVASMMMPGTIPFSVNTKEYTVSRDMIRDTYYVDGKPVGMTKVPFDPKTLPCYTIQMPEEYLVRGLKVLNDRNEAKLPVTSGKMVAELKAKDIWFRGSAEQDEYRKTSQRQADAVYYQRDYVSKWVRNGWVEKAEYPSRYVLTDEGRNIVETFYVDRPGRFGPGPAPGMGLQQFQK